MSYLLGGEPMKAWLSFLATAVVCVSAFAQQPPPDVKQKVDSLIAKLRDAYVKDDAAAFARAFTSDGILVTLTGKVLRGQQNRTGDENVYKQSWRHQRPPSTNRRVACVAGWTRVVYWPCDNCRQPERNQRPLYCSGCTRRQWVCL